MYKNYIFDLYGTLIDINTDEWSAQLWKKTAILYGYKGAHYTYRELQREYGRLIDKEKKAVHRRHPEYKVIDIKLDKVFRALYTQKGVKPSKNDIQFIAAAFRCFSTKYIKLYDGVIDLLDTLKANGKKIYLLCISSDEECSKPDRNYYQILFDRYGLKKHESIMIGNDWQSDIGGAADFGIDSLYIHQSISPVIEGKLRSTYTVMDGDVFKIKKLTVK